VVNLGELKVCRVCENPNIKEFFNLGNQPPANSLLKSLDEKEKLYPLALSFCFNCNLVQLNYTIDPKELFSDYVWITGSSQTAYEYAKQFYERVIEKAGIPENGYVLEIASNDGVFLKPFIENSYKVLGIDPAKNIAEMAEKNGIPTKAIFWGKETAEELLKEKGPADFIFARNVLPHVANTRDFVEGLALNLKDKSTLVIEAHYAQIILDELHYDSIYHEHLCYFTFKSLEKLLNDFGLFVFDIDKSPISGGSMVVYAKKQKVDERSIVEEYRQKEKREKTNEFSNWENFSKRSLEHKEKMLATMKDVVSKNERVIGWGASARSSTLLNFCGIDSKMIPIIADSSPLKHKHFTAGSHILIDSHEIVMQTKPTAVIILAWNFAHEIMESLKNRFNFKGICVIPLPKEPRVEEIV